MFINFHIHLFLENNRVEYRNCIFIIENLKPLF